MIQFRLVSDPAPPGYEPGAHWVAEFYADGGDMPFPLGTAYVTAMQGVAWIDFIHVVDQLRRQGVGTALGLACMRRWRGIHISEQSTRLNPSFAAHLRRQRPENRQWCSRPGCEGRRYPEWR